MSISQNSHLDPQLTYEFMGAVHKDLDKVKAMIEEEPGLANAAIDVGGNFETAQGAAAHMGREDIAEYLLSKGARMDVFCAAMMGKIDIVKAFIADDPNVVHLKGPHGIPLIKHAERSGQTAVIDLLKVHGAEG